MTRVPPPSFPISCDTGGAPAMRDAAPGASSSGSRVFPRPPIHSYEWCPLLLAATAPSTFSCPHPIHMAGGDTSSELSPASVPTDTLLKGGLHPGPTAQGREWLN